MGQVLITHEAIWFSYKVIIPTGQIGKLRLGLVRLFSELTQRRYRRQNWHSPLGLFDTYILLSISKLLGLFGKWKEQRLRAEKTNVLELLRQD